MFTPLTSYLRWLAAGLVTASALAACGGSATRPVDPVAPIAGQADTSQPTAAVEPAAPAAAKFKLAKDVTLSAQQVELPGIPLYPGAQTLELPGIGSKMQSKVANGVATTVMYVIEDGVTWPQVAKFYKSNLEANGWKIVDGLLGGGATVDQVTPVGMLQFENSTELVNIRYTDGTQEGVSPVLVILHSPTAPKKN